MPTKNDIIVELVIALETIVAWSDSSRYNSPRVNEKALTTIKSMAEEAIVKAEEQQKKRK